MPCPPKPTTPTPILIEHTCKGCIHWLCLDGETNPTIASQKARPYIIIGMNNPKSSRVIVSPVSDLEHYLEVGTSKLKYPYHTALYKEDYPYLDKNSAVLLDQVNTIGKDELCEEWFMGQVNDCTELDNSIMYNYDLFKSIEQAFADLIKEYSKNHISKYSRK